MRALVEDTAESIRTLCADLRPPALDHAGLLSALEAYATLFFKRTGIPVTIECPSPSVEPSAEHATLLFRIFQEALTNIDKHAQATAVTTELHLGERSICLTISDNGRGFAPASGYAEGLGLVSMREMAELAGGTFAIQSNPDGGARVYVTI
jgi:signal transduction histidine kinase